MACFVPEADFGRGPRQICFTLTADIAKPPRACRLTRCCPQRALPAFISRFGCEHIKLRRQAIKASCNVVHNEGAVLGDTGPSREIFILFCEAATLCGAQH